LKELLADGGNDPQHAHKLKALEVLCRDVMKRLRDDQKKGKPAAILTFPDQALDELTALELSHPRTFELSDLQHDLQIDPMLLPTQDDFMQPEPEVPPLPLQQPVAFGIKPSPQSQLYKSAKVRLETLKSREYAELERIVMSKWADGNIAHVDRMLKTAPDAPEIPIQIENDDEPNMKNIYYIETDLLEHRWWVTLFLP
jgi:hypothetical protein